MREWVGLERRTEGIDTEKGRIICLIHERLWLSARSSCRVPPLMAPSPFLPLALSFHSSFFCLIPPQTSLTVLILLHHPSSPPFPLFPISPLLSLALHPQLISSSSLICCPLQFYYFNLARSQTHAPWLRSFPITSCGSSPVSLALAVSNHLMQDTPIVPVLGTRWPSLPFLRYDIALVH